MSSTSTIGLAVLGLGVQGRRMISRLPEHGRVRAVAAWDPAPQRLGDPGVPLAASAEALVRMPGVDCVFIASPPALHMDQSNLAFDAGKAVFCEKPLAVDAAEARATIARIEAEGLRAAVNFSSAASTGLAELLAAVERQEAGELEAIEIEVAFAQWPRPWQSGAGKWLAERKEGGFTREVLSHFIFALQRALGRATVKTSSVQYPADGVGAEIALEAELDALGVPVKVRGRVGGDAADSNRVALVGGERTIEFRDWLATRDGTPVPTGDRVAYLRQLDHLVAFVEGKPHVLPGFGEGLAVQETIEGMLAT